MKLLFENWRKYLNEVAAAPYSQMNRNIKPQKDDEDDEELLKEAAKSVDDLPEGWFVKIVKPEDNVIRVELLQLDSQGRLQRIPGRKDPFSVVQAMHSDHPAYGEEYSELNTYIIQKSSAPAGYGPLLYDIILELAGESGVTPDQSGIVSNYAKNVWDYYDKIRNDVYAEPFGEEENNILKKIYKKDSQETINKLKNAIPPKLIEDDTPTEEPKFAEEDPTPFDPSNPEEWDFLEDLYENVMEEDSDKVSKVVIYDKNGKILLLKRADGKNDWDLPGGHLKKSENYEEGAVRETKEETNLSISGIKHVNDHEKTKFFKCLCPKGDISLQKEEHIDFKWVNPKEINQFQIRKSLKNAILSAIETVNEDFQAKVKKRHTRMKIRLVGKGGNTKKEGPGIQKPSFKRSKSGPVGFAGG